MFFFSINLDGLLLQVLPPLWFRFFGVRCAVWRLFKTCLSLGIGKRFKLSLYTIFTPSPRNHHILSRIFLLIFQLCGHSELCPLFFKQVRLQVIIPVLAIPSCHQLGPSLRIKAIQMETYPLLFHSSKCRLHSSFCWLFITHKWHLVVFKTFFPVYSFYLNKTMNFYKFQIPVGITQSLPFISNSKKFWSQDPFALLRESI